MLKIPYPSVVKEQASRPVVMETRKHCTQEHKTTKPSSAVRTLAARFPWGKAARLLRDKKVII